MAEPAAAVTTGAAPGGPAPGAPGAAAAPAATAGATLQSVPAGADWAKGFKNEQLRNFVTEKKFTDPEQLVERYQNLEKLTGVPKERLLRLPEKMEGEEALAVWERLGRPKEAKEYGIPRDEKGSDPKFIEWAEGMFHQNNLTKDQALGVLKSYNEKFNADVAAHVEARNNALKQADVNLQKSWGARYEQNIEITKQGAKILGLDAESLNLMEARMGREKLYTTLHKIGVGVGEASFIDGGAPPAPQTPEQAQAEINTLLKDQKFTKKVARGDVDATAKWQKLHEIAAPGSKAIG